MLGLLIINGGECSSGAKGGRNSSVRTITRLQAGTARRGSSIPNRGKSRVFLISRPTKLALQPNEPTILWVLVHFLESKTAGEWN